MKKVLQEDQIISKAKRVHMIGIGGSGMCPIAEILHSLGYSITGSDNNESDPIKRLRKLGIQIFMGHDAKNIGNAELLIYSAAIAQDNPELVAARAAGIPTIERSHMLGAITRKFSNVIGVCGTHGKTTVTSLLTQILLQGGKDPTAVIGGRLPLINANGIAGKSETMVCEACEFVDTFLQLSPDTAVLLNIDNDHLDYFGTMDNLIRSFTKFVDMAKTVIVNGDDAKAMSACQNHNGKIITFGLKTGNDYRAVDICRGRFGMRFTIEYQGQKLTQVELSIPGEHNVYNALAAFATAHINCVEVEQIVASIEAFGGAGRRFEKLGEFNGVLLADDYAHHPTEITATLQAAKALGFKKVIAIFQPFTFSRTDLLKYEFIKALSIADEVILTPIMGSREKNVTGIRSEDLAEEIANCTCVQNFDEAASVACASAGAGDLILTMGGGDIYKAAYIIREILSK